MPEIFCRVSTNVLETGELRLSVDVPASGGTRVVIFEFYLSKAEAEQHCEQLRAVLEDLERGE